MGLKNAVRRIFEKGNAGLGWFVLWRMAVVVIPLKLIARLIAEQTGPNPAAGLDFLFVLPISGNVYLIPVAVPLVLILWNWFGKMAMRRKLRLDPRGFIGWALYWRFVLLQMAGVLMLALVLVPVVVLAQSVGESVKFALVPSVGLIGLSALVYWNLNVIGFVVKQVAATATAAPGEATELAPGRDRIRDYRTLFDVSTYRMNWLIAVAYAASGLVGMLVPSLVQGLFTGDWDFGYGSNTPGILIGLVIGGAALALFLHRVNSAWQVVAFFTAVLVLSLVLIEIPLGGALRDGFTVEAMFRPDRLLLRLSFAVLFCTGLLVGLRLGGPTVPGFALGIGAGLLTHDVLVVPMVWSAFMDIEPGTVWSAAALTESTIIAAIDAVVTGTALWWACDWHLNRHGLRLTQQGSVVRRES